MPEPARPDQAHSSASARVFRGLGLSVTLLLLAVALLELAGLVVPALSREALDPEVLALRNARVEPHPYLAYANKPGFRQDKRAEGGKQISHNALGFRNTVAPPAPELTWDKPAGVFRIACLGGSSTYGHGPTSDATTWPGRLQHHLGADAPADAPEVQVINAGCQGYSTFESLINLELRVVDLEPDVVLVYHGINDMRCALYRTPTHDNTHWRAIWPVERPSGIERLVQRSTTFLLLRSLDPGWKARRTQLGGYVIADFDPVADQYARSDPPTLGFDNIRRNLRSLVAVARAHGAEIVFVTQAIRLADLDQAPSRDMQVWGMQRVEEILREVAAASDVPLIDAAEVLEREAARQRAAGETGPDGKDGVFTNDVHITDAGADLLARTVAQGLVDLGRIPGR